MISKSVPAHAGGVDLSWMFHTLDISHTVPAHAGGVDLSFKEYVFPLPERVPAHAGGVDLSKIKILNQKGNVVPAHAGGVDLSRRFRPRFHQAAGPRPCGRGGFKPNTMCVPSSAPQSPPMRAGWI